MGRIVKSGEIYVDRTHAHNHCVSYAVIIHEITDNGAFTFRTIRENTHEPFTPHESYTQQDAFLARYRLATPEELEKVLARLKEEAEGVAEKIGLLEEYCRHHQGPGPTKQTNAPPQKAD